MKKIILMCLFGLMLSQAKMETRLFMVYGSEAYADDGSSYFYLLDDIVGFDTDFAIVTPHINIPDGSDDMIEVWCEGQSWADQIKVDHQGIRNGSNWNTMNCSEQNENGITFIIGYRSFQYVIDEGIKLAITAEFPIEDTGYIEEGFDFCLHSGQNLVSFPCENSVSVETALPELAQAEITSIIGEGVASTNINGQFLGSLTSFSPGAGYWFKSNSNMCFNYTCSE